MAASAIKMDELLVKWLASDSVYDNVETLIGNIRTPKSADSTGDASSTSSPATGNEKDGEASTDSPRGVIPPFYPPEARRGKQRWRRSYGGKKTSVASADETDGAVGTEGGAGPSLGGPNDGVSPSDEVPDNLEDEEEEEFKWEGPVEQQAQTIYAENGGREMTLEHFVKVTKEICRFPSFFNGPLWKRILLLWNAYNSAGETVVTLKILEWYYTTVLEDCADAPDRFYRLIKQPTSDHIGRDDFLPYIKELLNDHPGLEFLSNHAEFQEKYAVTVITRIFYSVNKCHSGRITLRQVRRSDLLDAFFLVDAEEDINKVNRYFSYEHFYVLYCRFWELDQDRDYRITREDLLKYGDHSLSHMIVDRIFDAAPRPFGSAADDTNKDFLSYEDFIFFMLSEEDKSNEVSVRYWFNCLDVDGDQRLNNMEMRSFYAVQLHRMQCLNHEIVPFEDMLCQMMDMIKPQNSDYLVAEDFLQPECAQVSGALFDALFNLNKYLMFEQRDPFVERQKREDEFETDWDRFACIDYNRLAMEEEAREEEAMEIDWVTVDEDDDGDDDVIEGEDLATAGSASSEAPF